MLAILAVFVAGPMLIPFVLPMSYFYELRSVTVSDADFGVSPNVIVDRTVHRDFSGRFEIEIMKAEDSEFSVYWACGEHDSDWRTYRDEAAFPPNMNLDWWMGIPPNRACVLPPGTYKIISTIYAQGWLGAILRTTTDSNVFVVRAPGVHSAQRGEKGDTGATGPIGPIGPQGHPGTQ